VNRIDAIFALRRQAGLKTLMPFVCGGFPAPGAITAVLPELERAGANIVEIGIPFSDPIADGPVIAAAMHEALNGGATPGSVFTEVAAVRGKIGLGLVAMVSVSIVQRMGAGAGPEGSTGPRKFVVDAKAAGFDGFIVPDLPVEESAPLINAARAEGLVVSLLVAPTSPPERVARIVGACSGFVYLLARAGITGERSEAPDVAAGVARIRQLTDLPIACGFGISTADHVRAVTRHADAAIVGSALIRAMTQARERAENPVAEAAKLVAELASGL
jgi:tryptophan synthase alpha chain